MATLRHFAGRMSSATLALLAARVTMAARRRRLDATRLDERRLELQALAVRRKGYAHQQRMHWELLSRAIDDPTLFAVIDTYDKSIPAAKRRQFLYANAWYAYLFHLFRAEVLDQEELYIAMRELLQNPLFREYWDASKAQRANLKRSSDEARVGRMIDGLVRDLDEADTDEWWVVGNPPSE